jgi:2-oxoglutarate dehydrogenase E2 component (dihydrolipoamide succinyltransferase)
MAIEIKIPSVGESIQEALLAEWFKKDGDHVKKDEPLFVIETDKVTLEIEAEADGILKIKVEAGKTVSIGQVVGTIDTNAVDKDKTEKDQKEKKKAPEPEKDQEEPTEKKEDREVKEDEKVIKEDKDKRAEDQDQDQRAGERKRTRKNSRGRQAGTAVITGC